MALEEAVKILVEAMTPYIGGHMAHAAVQSHCEKLKLSGTPSAAQLDDLVTRLGVGLNIFVGKEKSSKVVAEMKSALGAKGVER